MDTRLFFICFCKISDTARSIGLGISAVIRIAVPWITIRIVLVAALIDIMAAIELRLRAVLHLLMNILFGKYLVDVNVGEPRML